MEQTSTQTPAAPGGTSGSTKDRAISALLLFVPLALWPAVAAASAWRAGDTPGFVLALIGVGLAAIPPVVLALGIGWARKLAEAFALAGIAIGILFVLRNGVSLVAVPAVGYFVVYAFLSHERYRSSGSAPAAKPAEYPPTEHPLAWLKENVEAIAVAFIMALVIRCFCVEVFLIPSSSMEPTLRGASESNGGDRIMVTKLTYAVQDVGRFEPVVFKFPLNPMKNFIKRVVGLPNEQFVLHRGNVYTIPDGSSDPTFRIRRKPLRVQRDLWIDAWDRRGRPILQSRESFTELFTAENDGEFSVRDGVLSGGAPDANPAWRAYVIDDGSNSNTFVSDICFDAVLTLSKDDGDFWIEIRHDFGPFKLTLSPSGKSTLVRAGEPLPLKTPAFPAGSPVRVEFMVYDGMAVVLFDGRVQAEIPFQQTLDEAATKPQANGLYFGSKRIRFAMSNLRVGRDIYYKPKDAGGPRMVRSDPLRIPADRYFMLGDNVNNSHDGRAWEKHTVVLTGGRVIEYESQELVTKLEVKKEWARRHNCPMPDYLVAADIRGHEQAWNLEDVVVPDDPKPFNFVEGRFIIGRAFAVCWPLARCLRLIR